MPHMLHIEEYLLKRKIDYFVIGLIKEIVNSYQFINENMKLIFPMILVYLSLITWSLIKFSSSKYIEKNPC